MPQQSKFIASHVPMLWNSLVAEFGKEAEYLPAGGGSISIVLIWVEGTEDERQSPGRYSAAFVKHSDLGQAPQQGDAVSKDGVTYTVARVDAYAYEVSRIVLHERGLRGR